jgi:oxygen-independent coproporphyrinogen-3 oxidase
MFGLYVHIPFCIKKCDYCDFCSLPVNVETEKEIISQYVNSLLIEMAFYKGFKISTVYFGGGTPSILQPETIEKIFNGIYNTFDTTSVCEVTIEVNPGTADEDKIKTYKNLNITRISVGAQSFSENMLSLLGRIHSTSDIYYTIKLFHKHGIDNFNIDIISSIPGETMDIFVNDIKKAAELSPKHLSIYSLEIEPGTKIYNKIKNNELKQNDENHDLEMYQYSIEYLTKKGYKHYEISNFAIPGFECKHNINYWQDGEYIGIGLSATSHVDGIRYKNTSNINEYFHKLEVEHKLPITEKEKLTGRSKLAEKLFLGLRMTSGIQLTGEIYTEFANEIKELLEEKLINIDEKEGTVYLTQKGLTVANYVFSKFL